jgi:hypothetical protein
MKKLILNVLIVTILLASCGGKTTKKRNLDETLSKYASSIRWSHYDDAVAYLDPKDPSIKPRSFDIQKLKQYKVSRYSESPIQPGRQENVIIQNVEIELYNIHTNKSKVIFDQQSWKYDDELKQWFITSGIPKL